MEQKKIISKGLAALALAFAVGAFLPAVETFAEETAAVETANSENVNGGAAENAEVDNEEVNADNIAVLAETTEQEKASEYEEAVETIAKYDKLSALNALMQQVQEKEPKLVARWDMRYGVNEIEGSLSTGADLRFLLGGGGGYTLWGWLADDIAIIDGVITQEDLDTDINAARDQVYNAYKGESFYDLIELVKMNAKYASAKDFAEECEAVYDRGVASLRKNLPVINPKLTGLESKSGDELVALYRDENVVDTQDDKDFYYAYTGANMWLHNAPVDASDEHYESDLVKTYAGLVAATKVIDPDFAVDLSGVELLQPEEKPTPEQKPALPAMPNTGVTESEETSATVIKAAAAGLAMVVALIGVAVIVKRFAFSPLKRKH